MGFANDYLWAKLGGRPPDTRMRKLLRKSGGGPITEGEFGVEWDYSAPSPALTRTGDAVGFADPVPATTLTEVGSSPFDNIMPWAGMKMCNIIDGQVEYWQGDPQFSETDYDTMVYIPEFWYHAEKDTNASKWRWSISPTEKEGYAKHPGSGRYIGRFHSSGSSSGVYSKSGFMPFADTTRSGFRTYSHNKGAKWWMMDIATWSAIQLLYLIEFANFDSQDKLGTGQVSGSIVSSGGTTGAQYHTLKRSDASNTFRWLEDPFSNIYDFVDGFVTDYNSMIAYVGLNNSAFDDNKNALTRTNIVLPESYDGACITGLGFSDLFPFAFIPDKCQEDQTNFITDQVFPPRSNTVGTCCLYVGGGSSYHEYSGMFLFYARIPRDITHYFIGSRLIYIP